MKVYNSAGSVEYTEHHRVFLQNEPWPVLGGNQNSDHQLYTAYSEHGNSLTLQLEHDQTDGPEDEEHQPLMCTGMINTSNGDGSADEEPQPLMCTCMINTSNGDLSELSDDECEECVEKLTANLPNDVHLNVVNCSVDTDNNVQLETIPKQPEIQNLRREQNENAPDILQTKLALAVSKILGVTVSVKTLDKDRKTLQKHLSSNYNNDKYQDTLASIQMQVLGAHQNATTELKVGKGICCKTCLSTNI